VNIFVGNFLKMEVSFVSQYFFFRLFKMLYKKENNKRSFYSLDNEPQDIVFQFIENSVGKLPC